MASISFRKSEEGESENSDEQLVMGIVTVLFLLKRGFITEMDAARPHW